MENSIYIKLMKYCVVGFSGMVIDFSTTWVLKEKLSANKYLANATGFILSASFNYWLNRNWTFNSHSRGLGTGYTIFLTVAIIGLIINTTVIYIFSERLKWNFYISKLVAILVVLVWNFSMNYFITFKGD